jgi:hypothetical protein
MMHPRPWHRRALPNLDSYITRTRVVLASFGDWMCFKLPCRDAADRASRCYAPDNQATQLQ